MVCLGLLLVAATAAPAAEQMLIDPCQYPDSASAQKLWQPMRGSAAVEVARLDGTNVLRLPCVFVGSQAERASWDRPIRLDLSSGRGIEFKVLCQDATPVSHFSFYFQSGEGWYYGSFFPESATGWNTIRIDKSDMQPEGRPAGWSQIKAIRISAWRGRDANTEFCLKDLRQTGVLGIDASVALLRCDSGRRPAGAETRNLERYAATVTDTFRALNIECASISDLDVTAAQLRAARLLVLPYNPSLPDRAAAELTQYLNSGGKLLVFYTVPDKLRAALKIQAGEHVAAPRPGAFSGLGFNEGALPGAPVRVGQPSWNFYSVKTLPGTSRVLAEWLDDQGRPTGFPAVVAGTNWMLMTHVLLADDPPNKRRLLLALAGALAPDLWSQAAQAAVQQIGRLGSFPSYEEAVSHIQQLAPGKPQVAQALAQADAMRKAALLKLSSSQPSAEAIDGAEAAARRLEQAFCLAQSPLPNEFRAFWCHSAFGVRGLDWDEAIRRLATNGFNAILPNMLWGGAAFYPSKVLPVVSQVTERGDQIAQCLAACRKYGVQIHVWKVNWNLGSAAPKEFVERMRQAKRLQADSHGKEEPWLCPSHPENQKLEVASMVELVRNYDLDGIHFDYIRYPDADHCFCAGCRDRFQRATGLAVARWPADVLAEGSLRQRFLEWRRNQVTAVVKAVSEQARAVRPKIKISAAVFRHWVSDRDTVGQDWKVWCDRGYLDFVCPMDYTPSNSSFENMMTQQLPWAGRVPCYPGIGLSASSSRFGADKLIEQINLTRKHKTGGFVVFNYGVNECQEILPLLGLGITARP